MKNNRLQPHRIIWRKLLEFLHLDIDTFDYSLSLGVRDDDRADDHGLHLLHHVLRLLHLHQVRDYYIGNPGVVRP